MHLKYMYVHVYIYLPLFQDMEEVCDAVTLFDTFFTKENKRTTLLVSVRGGALA